MAAWFEKYITADAEIIEKEVDGAIFGCANALFGVRKEKVDEAPTFKGTRLADTWRVTHIPTGRALAKCLESEEVANALAHNVQVLDWDGFMDRFSEGDIDPIWLAKFQACFAAIHKNTENQQAR